MIQKLSCRCINYSSTLLPITTITTTITTTTAAAAAAATSVGATMPLPPSLVIPPSSHLLFIYRLTYNNTPHGFAMDFS